VDGGDDFAFSQAEGDAVLDEERLDVVLGERSSTDDLAESERHAIQRVVSASLRCVAKAIEFTIDRRFCPCRGIPELGERRRHPGRRRLQGSEDPSRKLWEQLAVGRDLVAAAGAMAARWCDDVPAIGARVDAGAEAASGVGKGVTRVREVEVPAAAASPDGSTRRQRTMLDLKNGEGLITAVVGVDVHDDETTCSAGSNGHARIGPPIPPLRDLIGLRGRRLEAIRGPWVLAYRRAVCAPARASNTTTLEAHRLVNGEDRPAAMRVDEGCVDRSPAAGIHRSIAIPGPAF
jgi:hypothetical protein